VNAGSGPILLGDFNSSNLVAQDAATLQALTPWKAGVDVLNNQVSYEWPAWGLGGRGGGEPVVY
jgi:hypothetical protein